MPEQDAAALVARLTELRRRDPRAISAALAHRRRRPLLGERGTLFLVAADHPGRGLLKVGDDVMAMADRGELLRRLVIALGRPGVDGVMATADIVEDLALLGALDEKLVFGSMNRGGLSGSAFELDDRFTGYTAQGILAAGLDGGKMMVRIADEEPASLATLTACAAAINALAERRLPAMVEVFASRVEAGHVSNRDDPDSLIRAMAIVAALGTTSAYTWLKLPVTEDHERVMRATTLPVVLLGGDPGAKVAETYERWRRAMTLPQVVGLVAGRSLLYPADGDVAAAVDAAADVIGGKRGEGA